MTNFAGKTNCILSIRISKFLVLTQRHPFSIWIFFFYFLLLEGKPIELFQAIVTSFRTRINIVLDVWLSLWLHIYALYTILQFYYTI